MISKKLPIVVLISGYGSNLQAIIDVIEQGLAAEIRAVISNNIDTYGIERAKKYYIPTEIISHNNFTKRSCFEQILQKTIDKYHPKLIVLAGFMRKLSCDFVSYYEGRILNIHPALLPKYPGLNTHARVLAAGDSEHGVSVHYVTEIVDRGPIICYAKILVSSHDTLKSLRARVNAIERIIYPQVLSWIIDRRLKLVGDKVFLDQEILPKNGKQIKLKASNTTGKRNPLWEKILI
ncbi:MAG: phosphoribosylglycinamide formyltransferase [Coxiella endosymbiont of Dermacentor silvarum]